MTEAILLILTYAVYGVLLYLGVGVTVNLIFLLLSGPDIGKDLDFGTLCKSRTLVTLVLSWPVILTYGLGHHISTIKNRGVMGNIKFFLRDFPVFWLFEAPSTLANKIWNYIKNPSI